MSISATSSSKASDIDAGIFARSATSTAPAATSVNVCPNPQQAPSHAALALLRSPVTSVDTAAR